MGFHSPLRKSHLQPTSSQPPSSFSRQTGSTFRDSLRRIPSSIFTRGDQAKKEMDRKKSIELLNQPPAYTRVASVRASVLEKGTIKVEKEKKPKTKTRKALGELFGWGNSSSAPAPSHFIISPPSPLRRSPPIPPAKAPALPTKDATILRKAAPAVLTRKASSNTFGTVNSYPAMPTLRAPLAPKHRPSLGEDPFGRDDTGAEVVVHAPKRDTHAASIKSDFSVDKRRESVYSARALSAKTFGSDDYSVQETAIRARMSSPRRVTMASVIEEKKRISNSPPRPISSTAPTINPLIAPPPRSDSLNYQSTITRQPAAAPRVRVTNAPTYIIEPAPALISVVVPAAFNKKPSMPAMRKEKTKSRVWGFLGLKHGKGKEEKENDSHKRDSAETVHTRPLILGSNIDVLRHGISRPNISAPIRTSVPAFHISHPSSDTSSAACTDSPSPMPRVMHPEPIWTSANSLIVDTPNKRDSGSTIASFTDFKAAIEEANGLGGSIADPYAHFLAGSKALPKRKSLNGLFGLSIERSSSDLRGLVPVSVMAMTGGHAAFEWTPPKLRPLSEEMEMSFGSFGAGGQGLAEDKVIEKLDVAVPDPTLRRVASATDKLVNLVFNFDFSPGPSPAKARLAPVSSLTCLNNRLSNSPTPIRKVKSAMLFHKSNTPPVKPNSHISPLKYVLQRAHVRKMDGVGIRASKPDSDNPPPTSLVKKGMRNPFAPPSPERGSGGSTTPAVVSESPLAKKNRVPITFGPAMGLAGFMDERPAEDDDGDVPADLRAMLLGLQEEDADIGVLGLPKPPMDRVAPRRPARAAPKISLPPVPPLPAAYQHTEASTPLALNIRTTISQDEDFGVNRYATPTEHKAGFTFTAATPIGDNRNSFDFTGEYEELDLGSHRASFVEALHRVTSADLLSELLPLPPLLAGPLYTIEQSPESVRTIRAADSTADMFADAVETTRQVSPARARKAPFQGTFAFQQQISHTTKVSPPIPDAAPMLSVPDHEWRDHHRGESGLSIATLSSVGDVLDTAENAREYTNYFEANFSQHLARQSGAHCRSRTTSTDSVYGDLSDPRAPTRRAHHRRKSSIISVESIGIVGQVLSTGLPPNSLYNNVRRSGYISKHRRDGSSDSAFGRSDWARHSRSISGESTSSAISVSRIARPAGPSERMFQLDVGVQLTSITGSPAEALHHARTQSWESTADVGQVSYDTVFDGPARDTSFDTVFDSPRLASESSDHNRYSLSSSTSTDKRSSGSSDSIFGADAAPAVIRQAFFLKGMRPVSAISSGMSSETGEDTFLDVKRYIRKGGKEECFEGIGEDRMTPIQETLNKSTGRSSLSGSMSRPAKPSSANRRRPAQLCFGLSDPETPGLASPSTSATSSRLSLETRFSSERGIGHFRQKSSANVHLQATIKEEISLATLRPPKSSASPRIRIQLSRENLRRQDACAYESEEEDDDESTESITAWLRFQREADEVCRQAKSEYRDSVESRAAAAGPQSRFSPQSVAELLAQSAAAYKPLNKPLPLPRDQAHRRKASLADARALTSPYGLPLPKPHGQNAGKPRGSLTTKFERSNSAGSTRMSDDPTSIGTPLSGKIGMFAHLMSDLVPSPPRSAPIMMTGAKPSPFAQFLPQATGGDVFNLAGTAVAKRGKSSAPPAGAKPLYQKSGTNQAVSTAESRARVDSGTRRKALGWGRRRNSDGPEQAGPEGVSKVIPLGAGLGPRKGSRVAVMKENSGIPPVPTLRPSFKSSTRKNGAVRPIVRASGSGGVIAIRA